MLFISFITEVPVANVSNSYFSGDFGSLSDLVNQHHDVFLAFCDPWGHRTCAVHENENIHRKLTEYSGLLLLDLSGKLHLFLYLGCGAQARLLEGLSELSFIHVAEKARLAFGGVAILPLPPCDSFFNCLWMGKATRGSLAAVWVKLTKSLHSFLWVFGKLIVKSISLGP